MRKKTKRERETVEKTPPIISDFSGYLILLDIGPTSFSFFFRSSH